MRAAVGALLAAAACAAVSAIPVSRFNKPLNTNQLDKEWAEEDVENDDWHEDTYSWREKDRKKHTKVFDPNDPEEYLAQALAGSGMQMIFVTLFPDTHVDAKQTEELGTVWASMLKTGGVHLSVYPMNANQLLFSQEDGRTLEVKEFLLSQPEVEKVRWKDQDWKPEDHHKEKRKASKKAARRAKRKVKLNAGKTKGGAAKPARKRVEL